METHAKTPAREPRGIVISHGSDEPITARFWAYMWSADEETSTTHWHQVVPSARPT